MNQMKYNRLRLSVKLICRAERGLGESQEKVKSELREQLDVQSQKDGY